MTDPPRAFTGVRKRNDEDGQHGEAVSQKKKSTIPGQHLASMFDYIRISNIKKAVIQFLETYQQDKMNGLFELKICIFQSAGCTRKYQKKDVAVGDKIILSYYEDWNVREPHPCILLNARHGKTLKAHFCEFMESLIDSCESSDILYDKFMLKKLISFFDVVTLSEDLSIRHVATLSALMTMRPLIRIILVKNNEIRRLNSQLNVEMQKPELHQDMSRVLHLQASIKTLKKNLEKVQNAVEHLRSHVLAARILDIDSKIRLMCVQEIREWFQIHPEMIVQDKFLDYLLLLFSNKAEVVAVHKLCSSILKSVFDKSGDWVRSFAKEIKTVLLRLAMCCETKLSSEAFCLLAKVSKLDVIEDKEGEQLVKFVYLDHPYRETAKMAGKFVISQLTRSVEKEIDASCSAEMRFLYHLLHFHIRNGSPRNTAILVDSVYEWAPILQNWKMMKTFILEVKLSYEEETTFISILSSCICRATMGQTPPGEALINFPKSQTKEIEDIRMKFSMEFVNVLPEMIRKFRDVPANISKVLLLTQCISLNHFVKLREENGLIELIKEIKVVMDMSSDWKVLEECARTCKVLCDEEHSTYAKCAPICDLMADDLGNKCLKICQDIFEVEHIIEHHQIVELLSALKMVAAYSGYFNMSDDTLFHLMIKCVNLALSVDDETFLECAKYSILSCLKFLISDLKKLNELDIDTFRSKLRDFMSFGLQLHAFKDENLSCEIFQGICQALAVFGKELPQTLSFHDLKVLVYRPPMLLIDELLQYLKRRIFVELPTDDRDAAAEEATMRRRCLHTFCSILVKSIINDRKILAEIFGHYIKFSYLFKDIFDGLIDVIKKQDEINFVLIIHQCFESEFLRIKAMDDSKKIAKPFTDLKMLALHFFKILGEEIIDTEHQKAVVLLHDEGIKFSMAPSGRTEVRYVAPPNIKYLEILIIFVKSLTPQGRKHSYQYLWKCEPFQETSDWKPVIDYRKALKSGKVPARFLSTSLMT